MFLPFSFSTRVPSGHEFPLLNYNWSTTEYHTSAALMLLSGAIIGGFAPFSGLILDKLGACRPILLGAVFDPFWLISSSHSWFEVIKCLDSCLYMIFMTGMGLAFGNIMTNGQKQLSLEEQPDANAIFNTQNTCRRCRTVISLIVAM